MAGKKGARSKKAEPIAVEAADSTSIEEAQQNGGVESVESLKAAAAPAAKKGRGAKKEVAEAAPVKKVEEKPKAAPKKGGRSKKEETATNGDASEEVNGDSEVLKEEPAAPVKKGRGKKEDKKPEPEPEPEVEKSVPAKKGGRPKKGAATETLPETVSNKEETETKIESPAGKKGKKRSLEAPAAVAAENGGTEEIIDTKKSKKETKSPEKPSKTATTSKTTESGRGRKKKESVEKETAAVDTNIVTSTPIATETVAAKAGRGRKRKEETAPVIHESVEDITSEDAAAVQEQPAPPKKEKKTKAAATKKVPVEKKTSTREKGEPRSSKVVNYAEVDEIEEPKAKKSKSEPKVKAEPKPKKAKAEPKPKVNKTDTKYHEKDFALDKDFNLKISSWNVGGLRSWISKGCLKYVDYEKPDIFCLQEIKCSEDMIPEEARISGYHPYWNCKPGGYAGVAIYSKKMPINVDYGLGDEEQDADGRIMTAEYEKFYLVNVYVPNAGRKLVTLPKRMRWDNLFQDYVKKLNSKKPVIICGDMNVSHNEIDLANPKTNKRNAGFTQEERDGMTKLLSLGFVDTFRHLYPDKKNAYTFWTYMMNARAKNVGWRLDYFIVSEKIIKKVIENAIRSHVMGSDHCPITLFLNI